MSKVRIVDRGQKFDLWNNRDYRNCNPNWIIQITKDVIDFYCRYGIDICGRCPVDEKEGKILCDDPEKCRYKNHVCPSKTKGRSVIETKTGMKIEGSNNEIFIARANLLWLYHNKVPFIFRPNRENGTIQHHKNGNHIDDRPENISILPIKYHLSIHSEARRLDNILKNYQMLVKEFPEKDAYKKGVEQTINLKHEITNVETPLEVWEMIWKIKTDIEASA